MWPVLLAFLPCWVMEFLRRHKISGSHGVFIFCPWVGIVLPACRTGKLPSPSLCCLGPYQLIRCKSERERFKTFHFPDPVCTLVSHQWTYFRSDWSYEMCILTVEGNFTRPKPQRALGTPGHDFMPAGECVLVFVSLLPFPFLTLLLIIIE